MAYWKFKFFQYLCSECFEEAPNNDPTTPYCPGCNSYMLGDYIYDSERVQTECEQPVEREVE